MFAHNLSGLCKKYDVIPDVILPHFYKVLSLVPPSAIFPALSTSNFKITMF